MAIPLIVVTILLLIATLSMPAVIRHLSARQFASLEMRRGGTWYGSLGQALWTTLVCLVLLVVTLPLWLIPPFFALIPPLLWGWLTYRVMTYDALALHASRDERRALVRRYRLPLLLIGVASGLLGSLPTLLWASSVWLIVLFPVITAVTIWIYAFILVFSALWFGYYCLRALQRMRAEEHGARHAAPWFPTENYYLQRGRNGIWRHHHRRRNPVGQACRQASAEGHRTADRARAVARLGGIHRRRAGAHHGDAAPHASPRATSCFRRAASAPRRTITRASARQPRSACRSSCIRKRRN